MSYHAAMWWAKGWIMLLLFNVLVLISEKPVPTNVWLWLNGIGLGMVALGSYMARRRSGP